MHWERLHTKLQCVSDRLILPEPAENSNPSWFGFALTVKQESGLDRNRITQYLEEQSIQTRLLFSGVNAPQ